VQSFILANAVTNLRN